MKYLKVFTFLSHDEIEDIAREHIAHPGERIAQKKLAYEVTKEIHGEAGAEEALKMSQVLFSGEIKSLTEEEIVELLGSLKFPLTEGENIVDALIASGAASSKTQARTFLSQNSVSINGEKVTDEATKLTKENALFGKYIVLRRGKKNYYLGEF